jgi:hypothetical protein
LQKYLLFFYLLFNIKGVRSMDSIVAVPGISVGIDVGSGFTQWMAGYAGSPSPIWKGMFPSTVGIWTREMAERHSGRHPNVVSVPAAGMDMVVGTDAVMHVRPDDLMDTLTADWSQSEGWYALFLAGLAQALMNMRDPDDKAVDFANVLMNSEISVAVGVPQAMFSTLRPVLEKKLNNKVDFSFCGQQYSLPLKTRVYPQAGAAAASIDDLSGADQPVGVIDVGTFTTGFAVMVKDDNGEFALEYPRSGGIESGGGRIANSVKVWLHSEHRATLSSAEVYKAMTKGTWKIRGEDVDIRTQVGISAKPVIADIMQAVRDIWKGGDDLEIIAIVGGAGPLVAPGLSVPLPQSRLITDAQWCVVKGLAFMAGVEI